MVLSLLVPRRGLEPPCRKAHAPKACVSTISPPRLLSGDYNSIGSADTGTSAFLILFMKNLVWVIQPSVETVL